jgi:hypothetical protein
VPQAEPPVYYDGTPNRYLLRRGTPLSRVHPQAFGAFKFKTSVASVLYGGARFDATAADPYPYLYVGLSEVTALAETLLRDVAPNEHNYRVLPNEKASGRAVSELTLNTHLDLVSLIDGRDLGAIGQDDWLVSCSARDYAWTRDWAHWLRRQAPWAHGLIWAHAGSTLVTDLGDAAGVKWANERLRPYRAIVSPPAW